MQTHTFIAESAHEAVEQIRAELGSSAVVLSVRRRPRHGLSRLLRKEQIEVVARAGDQMPVEALSPDWQSEIRQLKQQFAAMQCAPGISTGPVGSYLAKLGILPRFSEAILAALPADARPEHVNRLLRSKWRSQPPVSHAAVHLFVGVPGAGKSTVLCKMLAQTSLAERQPATIYQLDTHLANSSAKPSIYAEILGAQFERTAPLSFERREESVFVDLPGVSLGDERGLKSLEPVISAFGVPEVHLVLNGAYETTHLLEQIRFFSPLGLSSVVVSHLDEEPLWGKLWNLVLGTNCEITYLSAGQNVPGDLYPATPDLIFGRQS
jgi:flagellar biosynthesis GTPase FlhF